VGIKIKDQDLLIHFFHCKYSGDEDARKTVASIVESSPYYASRLLLGRAYEHQESHESVLVQAADFAAGIASYFYTAPAGLVEVVSRFEYVTFKWETHFDD
jgi:hypothetical protein